MTFLEQTKVSTRTKHTIQTQFTCVLCIFLEFPSSVYFCYIYLCSFYPSCFFIIACTFTFLLHFVMCYCDCVLCTLICISFLREYVPHCYQFITLFNSVVFLACFYQSVLQIMSHFYFVDYS